MADILIIMWYIMIFLSVTIGMLESLFFIVSLNNMAENKGIKKGLFFMFITSILVHIYAVIIGIFGIKKYSLTNNWWILILLIYSAVSIFFVLSTKVLLKGFEEISKISQNKKYSFDEEEE